MIVNEKIINSYTLELQFSGKFNFADYKVFHDISNNIIKNNITNVSIDMKELTFVDSAALGMLLILHEEIKKRNGKMHIENINGQVLRVFTATKLINLWGN